MYRESICAVLSYNSFNSKTTFTCTSEIFCFDLKQNISKEEIDIYNYNNCTCKRIQIETVQNTLRRGAELQFKF